MGLASYSKPRNFIGRPVSAQHGSRNAFTLIEMIMVLLIMAIMAAVAAPKYSQSLANFRLKAITQRIAGDIRQARRLAQQNSVPQTIVFDVPTNSYSLVGITHMDHRSQTYQFFLASTEYVCELVSADFNGSATLSFNVYGRPANTGSLVVRCGGISQTLMVDEVGQVSNL